MLAVVVEKTGGPDVLKTVQMPEPVVGPHEVLVAVQAAGVNFRDIQQRSGAYPGPLPFIPGVEGVGRIMTLGGNVTDLRVGQRVVWPMSPSSYAERVAIPASSAIPLDEDLTDAQAMGIAQGLTAHYLACSAYVAGPGATALVHAAAGGVGLQLVQILRILRARSIAAVSSPEKALVARLHGADEAIVYAEGDFAERARGLTGGEGVDVVYDGVGADTFVRSLAALRRRGCLINYGNSSGPTPLLDIRELTAQGSVSLMRPSLRDYISTREELEQRVRDLVAWIRAGSLQVVVGGVYALAEAAKAHEALEARRTTGKIYLRMNPA